MFHPKFFKSRFCPFLMSLSLLAVLAAGCTSEAMPPGIAGSGTGTGGDTGTGTGTGNSTGNGGEASAAPPMGLGSNVVHSTMVGVGQ